MVHVLKQILSIGFHIIVFVLFVMAIVSWIRNGAWLPRYVHAMALLALVLGLLFAMGGLGWIHVFLYPSIVYVVFVGKGGAKAARGPRNTSRAAEHPGTDLYSEPRNRRFHK